MIYKKIVDQAPVAIIYLGRDGKIIVWNREASKLLGYSSEDAVGQAIDLIIPERFRAAHDAGYANAIAKGKSKFEGTGHMKAKAVRSDGTKLIINVRMSMIRDDNNEITGMLAFVEKAV